MKKNYSTPLVLLHKVIQRFLKDGCMYYASALALTSLLALVPLMLVGVSVLAAFPVFGQLNVNIQSFIFSNFLPTSSEVLQNYLSSFVQHSTQLSLLGLISLIITAIILLFNIEQAFNLIWRVNRQRRGIFAFLLYWGIITLSPLLMGLSFALSSYIFSLPLFSPTQINPFFLEYMLAIIPFFLAVFVFTLLYIAIPNCTVPWRHALSSGIIAAALFEIAKYGFAIYLKNFNTYQIVYGTLAILPIFILWIYFSWLIILFGAELCHSFTYPLNYYGSPKLDGFTHAYLWLGYLWQAQQEQASMSLKELVKADNAGYDVDPEYQIYLLNQIKWVRRVENNRYILAVDLNQVHFLTLAEKLPWKIPVIMKNYPAHPWLKNLKHYIDRTQECYKDDNIPLLHFYKMQD